MLRRIKGDDRPVPALARQLAEWARAFAGSQDHPDKPIRYESSAREHLLTMAVVEAAYLSDRTGQPEHPHRLLNTLDFTTADCLTDRPKEIVE